jgi:hypothetical protein
MPTWKRIMLQHLLLYLRPSGLTRNQHTCPINDSDHVGKFGLAVKGAEESLYRVDPKMQGCMAGCTDSFQIVETMIILSSNVVDLHKLLCLPTTIDASLVISFEHLETSTLPFLRIALLEPLILAHY